jgi:hypothetical protein
VSAHRASQGNSMRNPDNDTIGDDVSPAPTDLERYFGEIGIAAVAAALGLQAPAPKRDRKAHNAPVSGEILPATGT